MKPNPIKRSEGTQSHYYKDFSTYQTFLWNEEKKLYANTEKIFGVQKLINAQYLYLTNG